MSRAVVEVDRATMGPERLAAKLTTYARLHNYVPALPPGRPRTAVGQQLLEAYQRCSYTPRALWSTRGKDPVDTGRTAPDIGLLRLVRGARVVVQVGDVDG
ncbi:hypothetical protein ABZV46_47220, partial [Streptomyces sp. NPDC005209]